jgi:branched-chain amino acid transport system ATP-binding protein
MSKPKLLLLDEPSLGLAPLVADSVFQKIEEINRLGVSVLLVEQNVQRCLDLTESAYVIESGKVALQGESSTLLRDGRLVSAYLGV